MTKILYKAKSSEGEALADFVDADTVQEAKQHLLARGLTDIVFLQAPTTAVLSQALIPDSPEQQRTYARLRARVEEDPGRFASLRRVAAGNAWLLAACSLLLLVALWRREFYLSALAVAGLALPFGLFFWNIRHLDRYQQLLRASAWGKWDEVRRLAALMRSAPGDKLVPFDLDVRLAQIQARQGDLAGALASLEKWRGEDARSPGLFEARVASVYSAARDYPNHIRMMEEAAVLSKGDPSRLVDVALAHARFGSAEKAQAALQRVETGLLPPLAAAFLDWIHGLLSLRAGRNGDAAAQLRAAVAHFRERAVKSPASWVSMALAAAHCALAEVRDGRRQQAGRTVEGFTHIIAAHGDPSLLRMLQNELPEFFSAA